MSRPIFTVIFTDKLNNFQKVLEFDNERDADICVDNYPSSVHESFETWDMEYNIVFGVNISHGYQRREEVED